MPTIDTLIGSCIDLEGVLRVLRERDSAEARTRLEAAVDTLTYQLDEYFAEQAALDYATAPEEEQPVQSRAYEPEIPSEEPFTETVSEAVLYTEPELPAEHKEVVAPEPDAPQPAVYTEPEVPAEAVYTEPEPEPEVPAEPTYTEPAVYTEPEVPAEPVYTEPEPVVYAEPAQPAEVAEKTSVAEFLSNRQQAPNARLLRAFTLNDRFRFCRTLFAGNDADFTDTLRPLADMDSYSEAEDYLLNDLLWDKADADTADFLAILSENMPK